MSDEEKKYLSAEDANEQPLCTDDPEGIYINPKLHKTPKQWVEFVEQEFGEYYPSSNKATIFAGWVRRGAPRKIGGGEFVVYYKIDERTTLYKWIK